MDRIKRLYGYLAKMKDAVIRIRVQEPDLSGLPEQEFDWSNTVYGDVKEITSKDNPEALGNYVTMLHYFDANRYHDLITGQSVTGVIQYFNKTTIAAYSKKQTTVETVTYGSEFIAARTCIDQIIDLRTYLRYLGVPICEVSYMFGDNKTVIDGATIPHANLHKRNNALSYHRVREAMASKFLYYHRVCEAMASKFLNMFHVPGECNPADILTKHWGYRQVWTMLQALLLYQGNTMDLAENKNDSHGLQAYGE
jgi:hypothetical protein